MQAQVDVMTRTGLAHRSHAFITPGPEVIRCPVGVEVDVVKGIRRRPGKCIFETCTTSIIADSIAQVHEQMLPPLMWPKCHVPSIQASWHRPHPALPIDRLIGGGKYPFPPALSPIKSVCRTRSTPAAERNQPG